MNHSIPIIAMIVLISCWIGLVSGQTTIHLTPLIITEDESEGVLKPNYYTKEMLQSIAGSANDPFRALQSLQQLHFQMILMPDCSFVVVLRKMPKQL